MARIVDLIRPERTVTLRAKIVLLEVRDRRCFGLRGYEVKMSINPMQNVQKAFVRYG
jgi:hypothetical protein